MTFAGHSGLCIFLVGQSMTSARLIMLPWRIYVPEWLP